MASKDAAFPTHGEASSTGYYSPNFAYTLGVPEPATMGLIGFGLIGLIVRRRSSK